MQPQPNQPSISYFCSPPRMLSPGGSSRRSKSDAPMGRPGSHAAGLKKNCVFNVPPDKKSSCTGLLKSSVLLYASHAHAGSLSSAGAGAAIAVSKRASWFQHWCGSTLLANSSLLHLLSLMWLIRQPLGHSGRDMGVEPFEPIRLVFGFVRYTPSRLPGVSGSRLRPEQR